MDNLNDILYSVRNLQAPSNNATVQSTLPMTKEQEGIVHEVLIHSEFYKNEHIMLRKEISSLIEENQKLFRELQTSQEQRMLSSSPRHRKGSDMVANLQRQLALTIQEKNSATDMWQLALTEVASLERELKAYEGNKHVELALKQVEQTKKEFSNIVEHLEEKVKSVSAEAEKIRLNNEDLKCKLATVQENLQTSLQNIDSKEKEMKKGLEITTTAITKIQELEALVTEQSTELRAVQTSRDEFEKALEKCHGQMDQLIVKEQQAFNKLQEALSIVDEAVAEREGAILLASNSREENLRLQEALADLIKEAGVRVKAEVHKVKEDYNEKLNALSTDMRQIENVKADKIGLLEQMKQEQHQLSIELESYKTAQEKMGSLSFSEHKMQAAFRELTAAEHHNYQANLENVNLRHELQNLHENHTKILEKKERKWQKAEERYANLCSQLMAAQEKIASLEEQLSRSSCKPSPLSTSGDCKITSTEKSELLSRLQEMQNQHLKTDIELQQHLECQRVLKLKWQTTIKSLTNGFEIKIRDLRSKLHEMKLEKRAMQDRLNAAVRDNNVPLIGREIKT